jgi:N-acetyl-gamma-glutamyl-phosphate reductase
MKKIKAAIAGGTGYTAGELIRILIRHPYVEIISVLSSSTPGAKITSFHRDLLGETDMSFVDKVEFAKALSGTDVVLLCLGHGLSREFLDEYNLGKKCKVIDLGNDFRIEGEYGDFHFVYGLCDLFREKIRNASYIANPGCFATAILLALSPLAMAGELTDEIHIHAITGSTGAGRKLSESSHFSYRDNNISVYKPFNHQHIPEIRKSLGELAGNDIPQINFVPLRGDFTRGIFASIYTRASERFDLSEMIEHFNSVYKNSPYVIISDENISLKEVVNTNKALIHLEKHNGYWHLTSVIDNLIKGASGQAIQNMNIMFGYEENCALSLKGSAF